jgi:hypothetical protein
MLIAILEFTVEPTRNDIADGRLSGTHWADEDDVAMIHATMITANKKKAATRLPFLTGLLRA